ncbi:MAG: NADAR family protein [Actinobacteria bacterium]|nr:NADAR family protein [Actinomycetota bacterium]
MPKARISRKVGDEQIEGAVRPVFRRNGGQYFLADLEIYADGSIYCWQWLDLAGLKAQLASGRIATSFEEGAEASIYNLASWRFAEPKSWLTPDMLTGEVADEIDRLNQRPDSTGRCLDALRRYLDTRAGEDQDALRAAFEAIPAHLRMYALGDQNAQDWPLRFLTARPGPSGQPEVWFGHRHKPVTEEMHRRAIDYFAHWRQEHDQAPSYRDGPAGAGSPTIRLVQLGMPVRWAHDPGVRVLSNEYPAPITVDSVSYPTVLHAYWALAAAEPDAAERIRLAERPYDAWRLAEKVTVRPGWPAVRAAVMARLLRAKFAQHPQLAEALLATGDGRIEYGGLASPYSTGDGRNWAGRPLELIRSELAAGRAAGGADPG